MKFLKKTLSVGLSLVLCASMTVPAFAAACLNEIDDGGGYRYIDSQTGALKAYQDEDGNDSYDYYLNNDLNLDKTLVIKDGANASIDLNGHDLSVKRGEKEYKTVVKVVGNEDNKTSLTVTDNSEGADGSITGGKGYLVGGGVDVDGGKFTLESGSISGNYGYLGGGGVDVGNGGEFIMNGGTITGNKASQFGGGVNVNSGGSFTMNGGTINNNEIDRLSGGNGGGVYVTDGQFTMNNGTISGNHGCDVGGGVFVNTTLTKMHGDEAQFIMNGGTISGNSAKNGGGIGTASRIEYDNNGNGYTSVEIKGGNITGNHATVYYGGGIYAQHDTISISNANISGNDAVLAGGGIYSTQSKVNVTDSALYGNVAEEYGDDLYSTARSSLTLERVNIDLVDEDGNPILVDGKPISGFLKDDNIMRWNADSDTNVKYADGQLVDNTSSLGLKAAHDKYFDLTFKSEGAEDVVVSQEKNSDFPEISVPTRDGGYTFSHWALVDADGNAMLDENGEPIVYETLPEKVTEDMILVARWNDPAPAPVDPTDPIDPTDPGIEVEDPDVPLGDEPEVDIEDPAVPLASGPVTRAQFVDYLWRHEGEPAPVQDDGLFEDVTDEHEYSTAMAWAKSIGIIEAYEDGTFEPDELVTVSAVRSILTRFAAYADMTMPALTTLTGAEDEAVLNCDEVLAEFFGEEYAPAKSEDIDIAA